MSDLPNGVSSGNDVLRGAFCQFITALYAVDWNTECTSKGLSEGRINLTWFDYAVEMIVWRHQQDTQLSKYCRCAVSVVAVYAALSDLCNNKKKTNKTTLSNITCIFYKRAV